MTFLLFVALTTGYHELCAMFDLDDSPPDEPVPSYAYTAERDEQLRRYMRPTFLVAFAAVLLQLVLHLFGPNPIQPAQVRMYMSLLTAPLVGVALSYLPASVIAGNTISVIFDVAFTAAIASFLLLPEKQISAVTVAISLKIMATAILVPWKPSQHDRSVIMTLIFYGAAVWLTTTEPMQTHQLVGPILAGILGTYGCRRLDRTHRHLFEHSAELEASGRRLSAALAQKRLLLEVARETSSLTDLRSVLQKLNEATAEATGSAFSTIFIVREEDDSLELLSAYGDRGSANHPLGTRFPQWSGSPLHKAMTEGKTVAVDDVYQQRLLPPRILEKAGIKTMAFSPIATQGRLLGVLAAGRLDQSGNLSGRVLAILAGIAAHAATTINNARLYDHLAASESAYRDLFERANDLIFVADLEGTIHFANQAALHFFEASQADLKTSRWMKFLDAAEVFRIMRRARIAIRRDSRNATPIEIRVNTGRGDEAILEVRARLISAPGQAPERYQCIARDVTERSRRDDETRALLTRLQESQRLQDEFVANMSHELRTPLNVIIGYADLIADDLHLPINSDARSFLDRIGAASRALHRMVESILEYARLDRGRMIVIPTNFSSDHLLLELRALCNDVRSSVQVKLEITQLESIEFLTDYDRLYSLLSNLMLNALKFTPRGTIKLSLSRDDEYAVFRVRDTGIGIEPSELRSVFEPFRQVDGSDTRAFGGVGLGLAIVRRNVDLLQGEIDVDSRPSEGTTFEVRIPVELVGAIPQRASSAA